MIFLPCPVLICYLLFLLQIQSPFCLSISDAVHIQLTSSTHYFFSKAYFTGVASLVFFLPLLLFVSLYRFHSYFSVVNQVNWYSVPNWRNANEPTRVTVPGFFHLGEPLVCFYWPFFILVLNSKWGGDRCFSQSYCFKKPGKINMWISIYKRCCQVLWTTCRQRVHINTNISNSNNINKFYVTVTSTVVNESVTRVDN